MKYIVDVKGISYGRVEVEAESVEEAQEKYLLSVLFLLGQLFVDSP